MATVVSSAASSSLGADSVTHSEARRAAADYLQSRLTTNTSGERVPFEIPVIDIGPSYSSSKADRQGVADQIRAACINSGFFHITGHNVPLSARNGVLKQAERFLKDLPESKKTPLHIKHSDLMRGWEPSDYSYVNPSDWDAAAAPETKQCFNWGYEPALDPTGGDGAYVELDGSTGNGNVWPSEDDIPGFFDGIKSYYSEVLALARHLFRLFALSLSLPEDHFDSMTTHPGGIARLLYYPPAKDPRPYNPKEADKEIGLGAHSDYECFTLLLCSSATGLEILSPDNVWTPVTSAPDSFIVNVADFLMRWTNGVYRSTVHRVVNRTGEERYSVPFFFSVNYDQLVETLPSCITPDNPSEYPPIRAGEYILERLKATTKEG